MDFENDAINIMKFNLKVNHPNLRPPLLEMKEGTIIEHFRNN